MITFTDAQAVVRKEIPSTYIVAHWGYESEEYWQIVAGDPRFITGFDPDYASFDDVCYLVGKTTGEYETRAYVSNFEFFADFKPYGDIPEFFQD